MMYGLYIYYDEMYALLVAYFARLHKF
jgi:hypothetical protein